MLPLLDALEQISNETADFSVFKHNSTGAFEPSRPTFLT